MQKLIQEEINNSMTPKNNPYQETDQIFGKKINVTQEVISKNSFKEKSLKDHQM